MLINQPESVTETSNAAAVPTFGNNNCIFDILLSCSVFFRKRSISPLRQSHKNPFLFIKTEYIFYTTNFVS